MQKPAKNAGVSKKRLKKVMDPPMPSTKITMNLCRFKKMTRKAGNNESTEERNENVPDEKVPDEKKWPREKQDPENIARVGCFLDMLGLVVFSLFLPREKKLNEKGCC